MFTSWKRKVQNKAELEIVLGKLEFLAGEFERSTDRKIDAYHWKQLLSDLHELHDGSVGTRHAHNAYRVIYNLFLVKHSLSDEMTLDELLTATQKQ